MQSVAARTWGHVNEVAVWARADGGVFIIPLAEVLLQVAPLCSAEGAVFTLTPPLAASACTQQRRSGYRTDLNPRGSVREGTARNTVTRSTRGRKTTG